MKVHHSRDRLERAGTTAVFVAFDEPELLRDTMLDGVVLGFPVTVDRDRSTYRDWGLTRASWRGIWLDPAVWRRYWELLRAGERFRGTGEDRLQLGGDFVVAPGGRLAYARPQRRDDRPPVAELIRAAEAAAVDGGRA